MKALGTSRGWGPSSSCLGLCGAWGYLDPGAVATPTLSLGPLICTLGKYCLFDGAQLTGGDVWREVVRCVLVSSEASPCLLLQVRPLPKPLWRQPRKPRRRPRRRHWQLQRKPRILPARQPPSSSHSHSSSCSHSPGITHPTPTAPRLYIKSQLPAPSAVWVGRVQVSCVVATVCQAC